jgi:hypothetical protein
VSELGPRFVSPPSLPPDFPIILKERVADSRQINTRKVERDIYDGDPGLDKKGLWERAKL